MASTVQDTAREREHFFGRAKLVASLTVLSRILGMVRDMAITSLGTSRATGAFVLAFQIPNLFRRLFGEGALSGAFVPVLVETQEAGGAQRASRLFANALGLLAVFLLGLMVLVVLGVLGWQWLWPGEWDRSLLVRLVAIMMPFMVTICLLALASAALNCRGHFAWPAAAPIVLNVFMIAAVAAGGFLAGGSLTGTLTVLACAVVAAGAVQIGVAMWLARRSGFSVRPRLTPVEPGIRPMLRLMLPMLIGMGFLQFSPFFDSVLIWVLSATPQNPTLWMPGGEIPRPLNEGAQVQVYAAQRLYQFPMGVLAISLAVAIFPLLSRQAARDDMAGFRGTLNRALRLASMEGLASGVGLFVLAEPITWLIYRRRSFTPQDVQHAAGVLRMYALGMWSYCSYQMFSRAFFSLKQPSTPLKVSCFFVLLNLALVFVLIWVPFLAESAFGLATAVTSTCNVLVLGYLLRKRLGRIGGRALATSFARSLVASGAMAGAIYLLRWLLAGRAPWQVVAVCVPTGAIVFLATAWALRAPELAELLGPIAQRLHRSGGKSPEIKADP